MSISRIDALSVLNRFTDNNPFVVVFFSPTSFGMFAGSALSDTTLILHQGRTPAFRVSIDLSVDLVKEYEFADVSELLNRLPFDKENEYTAVLRRATEGVLIFSFEGPCGVCIAGVDIDAIPSPP